MTEEKKIPHGEGPHNILGSGRVTKCPPECPAHEQWLKSQVKDVPSNNL